MRGLSVVTVLGPGGSEIALINRDKAFPQEGWAKFVGQFFHRGLMLLDSKNTIATAELCGTHLAAPG
jgi:hypothetical protein